jgi:hypothetical protein
MLNFDIKELTNVHVSQKHLLDYYNQIVNNFQRLKWTPNNIDTKDHLVDKIYSWAIQSNLKNPNLPCPPYDIKHDEEVTGLFDTITDLYFGMGKLIIDSFPSVRQTVISAHPPGTVIQQHIDNDEFVKIHIPIIANDNSYFVFGNKKYCLEVGKAYLINTTIEHGTENFGNNDRVHLIFKIKKEDVEQILNNDYILDPTKIDFDIFELPKFNFDLKELTDYYKIVKNNYGYFKWEAPKKDLSKDPKSYPPGYNDIVGIYGYAVQTNLKNINIPSPVFNDKTIPMDAKLPYATNKTKLYFGFAEKLIEKLPYIEELVITAHPPNSKIQLHTDNYINIRIHIPIEVNQESYFVFEQNKYVLEIGKAYLVNTSRLHGTDNQGDSDRIHLLFKIPIGRIKQIINTVTNI